jgi:NADPH2:quinone reductase
MPQAIICEAFAPVENLRLAEVPHRPPGPGEIVVAIEAVGLNYPEALMVEGRYQIKPALPFTPGNEAAGRVTEVGGAVTRFKPGDAVVVRGLGTYATEATVEEGRAFKVPDGLDLVSAAAFPTAYGTAWYALVNVGRIKAGDTVLVLGAAGGVGLAAVDIARMHGATVIAAASSAEKLGLCRQYGAAHLIDYDKEDLRARLRELAPDGVDLALDPVGGRHAEPALRGVGWMGRYLVVGFAAGEIPRIPLNLVLVKGSSIHGVWWTEFGKRDREGQGHVLEQVAQAMATGKLRPHIGARYPLKEAGAALRAILDRKAVGKLVLTTG